MNRIITIIIMLAVFPGWREANAQQAPASPEQLRAAVEAALKAKDAGALTKLFCWEGVSDNFKTMMSKMATDMPNHEWTAVTLAPLPADYQTTNEVNGVRYRPSVPVAGWVVVDYTPKGNSLKLPYGRNGGGYWLACNVEEKIPGPVTKSKLLNIMVAGTAGVGTFSGSYVYLQGGKEIKQTIINRGASFYGDRIKSCTVQKTTDNPTSIQLTIMEDGKTVFESEEITNKAPVIFQNK